MATNPTLYRLPKFSTFQLVRFWVKLLLLMTIQKYDFIRMMYMIEQLEMEPYQMGLFTKEEIRRYSEKFLCGLYGQTGGSLDRSANSLEIYIKYINYGAYERPQ